MAILLPTLILISLFIVGCNMTFSNHKDYELKLKDLDWNTKIEGQVGEVYLKGSNLIYGRNHDSTFIEISSANGALLSTLHPYTIEKERECLILDSAREYRDGYSLFNVPVDKQKYSKITLKVFDRQYRGDTETSYLIVNPLTNQEFTILFNRKQFTFISDITHFKDGKFIVTYNGEAATDQHRYLNHVGLFDLDKIMSTGPNGPSPVPANSPHP
ncbi:MAG: hypothetical protein NTY77_18490 [Elusimicrobia bacterium]|nr:hypothetical protein [Elusimicrobiota bacterium]